MHKPLYKIIVIKCICRCISPYVKHSFKYI